MREEFHKSIEAVAEEDDANVFLYAGPLSENSGHEFIELCPDETVHTNAVLYLTTYGGSPDAAYRITRHLQHKYSNGKVILVVDSMCKSAGTLIAVGAHTIAMSERGELGPLDVQVRQRDEVFGVQSSLVAVQALGTLQEQSFSYFEAGFMRLTARSGGRITTRTAAELASSLAGSLFGHIYAQLDPMRLGENYRQMLVSREYATRLARASNIRPDSVDRLITTYPSHGFVIDRMEAKTLFPDVRELTKSESELAVNLEPIAASSFWEDTPTVAHLTGDAAGIAAKLDLAYKGEEDFDDETTGNDPPAGAGEDAEEEPPIGGDDDREPAVG